MKSKVKFSVCDLQRIKNLYDILINVWKKETKNDGTRYNLFFLYMYIDDAILYHRNAMIYWVSPFFKFMVRLIYGVNRMIY